MKKLNNKGVFSLASMTVFLSVIGSIATSTALLTDSHRERKAVEYCQAEGRIACDAYVSNMSKDEVLDYIKDTARRPRP